MSDPKAICPEKPEREGAVELVHVYATKVWCESDAPWSGTKRVVMQHQAPGCEPFTYCSFHYDYRYTSNAMIRRAAETMARTLGATDPIEWRDRPNSQA